MPPKYTRPHKKKSLVFELPGCRIDGRLMLFFSFLLGKVSPKTKKPIRYVEGVRSSGNRTRTGVRKSLSAVVERI